MTTAQSKPATPPSGDADHPYRYNATFANAIEPKWQARWEQEQTFRTPNPAEPSFDAAKPKFFCMDMFPYPSGSGLHVGHPEGYTATDIISRYKRHRGFNVLHPMGWDAYGLPAEQYAIQTGVHPAITTKKAIDTFRRQLKRFGFSYDWSREFATIDPDYYKWTQWIFLRIYNAWYDTSSNRARPTTELIAELESGKRLPRINPDAAEFSVADKANTFGAWKSLCEHDRRAIIDSYRLAYIGEQTVNWCPKLGTALANEEVIDGKSERGGYPVFRKPLRQWMFRITAYAERLLNDLQLVKWPESTRVQQTEWIGRSEGAEIDFAIADAKSELSNLKSLRVFTTRPDTIFGATFMVVAPEHPLVNAVLKNPASETDVAKLRAYVDAARNKSDVDRQADTKDKTGVFTGVHAINPATNQKIPIWTADYVLMGYGHGAIMAVPGHDERDGEFARKFKLPIIEVVAPPVAKPGDGNPPASTDEVFVDDGIGINSASAEVSLNGLPTAQAKQRIIEWLEKTGKGSRKTNYKLRDWLFSRQRYWGEPFPIVFDEQGFHHPIDEKHLPVLLPEMADYQPIESDVPAPLLGKATSWVNTTAGEAGVSSKDLPPNAPIRRETNTMPGWAGSCWYYLRYCDPKNAQRFVSRDAEKYWMVSAKRDGTPHAGGVDLYIGGNEHAVLHLLYARFWHKALFDLGEVSTPEPFGKLFHQGLITSWAFQNRAGQIIAIDQVFKITKESGTDSLVFEAGTGEQLEAPPIDLDRQIQMMVDSLKEVYVETSTGLAVQRITAKMSKSLKNVVNPDDVIAEYGADTFRLYEMAMGPLEQSKPWNPRDIEGQIRFLSRLWRLVIDEQTGAPRLAVSPSPDIERQLHRTIAKVQDDIERLNFNTAIAAMIELNNAATKAGGLTRDQVERLAVTLAPFAPHMAEEIWSLLGHGETISHAPWPAVDPAMLRDDSIELPVQVMGKVRGKITVAADADEKSIEAAALIEPKVAEALKGKTVRKVVVVPGKIVNIVAN
jgi:leucyl-tRNA synthetase